jgi:transcriptional regulator with XRE-family HTH domain
MMPKTPNHHHLYTCLGNIVSFRRKRLHMSQPQLAQKSGIDRVFISNIEQGKRKPSFGSIASIAHGLGIRYARLVGECEECMKQSDQRA